MILSETLLNALKTIMCFGCEAEVSAAEPRPIIQTAVVGLDDIKRLLRAGVEVSHSISSTRGTEAGTAVPCSASQAK